VLSIPTLGQRVYVQNNTIRGGKLKSAPLELRNGMSTVLENPKFNKLLTLPLGETRGRGGHKRRKNIAFVLEETKKRVDSKKDYFYSESSFSLGEIFTLNLLFQLQEISNNSLLVIDELEVALHPRVQINLLNYITKKAKEKNLTVLISTHSSSLIKCASNLIYLNNENDGDISVHYNCYPTLALQEVAVEEDMQPDYVFFVEDSSAELLLKEMIKTYFKSNPTKQQPIWKILPIGGYSEVLRFTKKSNQYLLHRKIGQYAFLDQDVEDTKMEIQKLGSKRSNSQNNLLDLFKTQDSKIKYLPITPELGLWNWINENKNSTQTLIKNRFPDSYLNISDLLKNCDLNFPHNAKNVREEAKNKINWLTDEIANATHEEKKRIKFHLYSLYIEGYYCITENLNSLNRTFAPIFGKRGN
jgi:energy-coupling factor transporter ATP-binding protein EcfA2